MEGFAWVHKATDSSAGSLSLGDALQRPPRSCGVKGMRMIFPVFSSNATRFPCRGTAPDRIGSRFFSCTSRCTSCVSGGPKTGMESTGDMNDHSPSFLDRSLDGELVERTYRFPEGESNNEADVMPPALVSYNNSY